jgi:hypothetical protein
MNSKEKAEELVDKFREYSHTDFNYTRGGYQADTQIQNAKQCALICCDEVLGYMGADRGYSFWVEVKQEIEKI